MAFSTYSLVDIITTINHPDVGKFCLSDGGGGRITISHSGDMFSNTRTATGYVTVNKMRAVDGTCVLEIPTNSDSDKFLRKWITYIENCPTKNSAVTSLTLYDPVGERTITLIGVVPQKKPDENYDQTAGNRSYALLYAEMEEK